MSKKYDKNRKGNNFEVRILETKYGLKVMVRQGNNRVWLNENHLVMVFQAILDRIFKPNENEKI
ncbi:MAG: hypothetical protein J7K23_07955 [Thermoproteales archaeon]|nr:hypothetical protein [Thermoproteales archaeon]